MQRSVGNAGLATVLQREDDADAEDGGTSPVKQVVESGGGHPLDGDTQSFMESRMGQDLSSVRIHTDSTASASAESVQAKAYTVGENVVFRSGEFNPTSDQGRRTLAHELTHVVQQREGPVDGEAAPGGIKVSTPGDRFEREADDAADEVMRMPADDAQPVQREEMPGEEEEELQTQREEMPGEEEEELQTQREEMPGEEEEELQTQREEMPGEEEEELQTQREEMPGEEEEEEEPELQTQREEMPGEEEEEEAPAG